MSYQMVSREQWDVADVPWAMKFRKGFAVHGAYWHDNFGKRRSHGCVNLSPKDARWVYDWTQPVVPAGWTLLEESDEVGTALRIRDRRNPTPSWRDWRGRRIRTPVTATASN
jgi:hypothetical protein